MVKKIFMTVAMLLMLTMMPMMLFSCKEQTKPNNSIDEPSESEKPSESQSTTQPQKLDAVELDLGDEEDSALVKKLGRVTQLPTGLAVDHVASGIEFRGAFKGEVKLDVRCTAKRDNEAYLAVFIDGIRVADTYDGTMRKEGKFHVKASEELKTITIADFKESGEHIIRVVKQTESGYSLLRYEKLSYTGTLTNTPPADKELYIEFIGDSLTCGMGSAGDNAFVNGGGSAQGLNGADWEDGTLGYAYRTAELLGADYSIISESGIGLADSWFDAKMGDFYTKTSYNRSPSTEYGFERVPDLVIINLGTNDSNLKNVSGHSINYTDPTIVKKEAKALIETVREKYGEKVPILWVNGVFNGKEETENQVNAAIAELGGEAEKIYSFKLTYSAENRKGAEGHPSAAAHQKIMEQICEYIRTKNLV